jgi:3-oxoacyl-[acyl-carrier protein] reductase
MVEEAERVWGRRVSVLHRQCDEGETHGAARIEVDQASSSSRNFSSETILGDSKSMGEQVPVFEPGRHLLNRRVILTGAGSGIGYAAAILFACHGANLVLCDLDEEKLQGTVDFIRNSSSRDHQQWLRKGGTGEFHLSPNASQCVAIAGDVTDESYVRKVIELAVKTFGGIDDLILNAGFTWDGTVHKMRDEQWDAMIDVHLRAPFLMVKHAAPYMRGAAKTEMQTDGFARPRSILTVSSVSGMHGNAGQANYAAGKAGVVGLTKSIAKEWGPFNIRANSLVFGHFKTRLTQDKSKGASISYKGSDIKLGIPMQGMGDIVSNMTALQRAGHAEEAAGAMLALTGPYASYITGQAIEVTGGGWM